jgi:transposase
MRGDDEICGSLFSYIDLEKRVRADHPLRVIRQIANAALKSLSGEFQKLYSPIGRESIPPERLMRALLLQAFYSIRSERQLVERIDTDLLFRWFVGLGIEDAVWDATSFTKNRDRLLDGEVASQFLTAVLSQDKSSACCRANISRSTAPCWRPGQARKAFAQRTARVNRLARGATASATSMASAAATTRMPRLL